MSRGTTILVAFAFVVSLLAFVLRVTGVDEEANKLLVILPGIAAATFGFMLWNNWKAKRG